MHLFFDALSSPARLMGYDDSRTFSTQRDIRGQEYEQLLSFIDETLRLERVAWSDIMSVTVIVGPTLFTAGRITCLTWNALARVHGFALKAVDFWTYCDALWTPFPRLLVANRAQVLIQRAPWEQASFQPLTDTPTESWWEPLGAQIESLHIHSPTVDAAHIRSIIELASTVTLLEPIYLKPPHITLPHESPK